jgi:SAM-dependent methyltransferase
VYELPWETGRFDVVHAHQVLQHLTGPVAALGEMARVTRPGGIVAVRDADYGSMVWHPEPAGMRRWMEVYRAAAQANGAQPDAGRRLTGWAHAAGLTDVTATASVWCYTSPEQCQWWGAVWARRVAESTYASEAIELGLATRAELREMGDAWLAWSRDPDAWFAMTHGEIIARV